METNTTTTDTTTQTATPNPTKKTTRSRKTAPAEAVVTTKQAEVGRAKDGLPRYGYTVTRGDEVLRDSGCQYKTPEAAAAAGARWLTKAEAAA
jgi:hypothetical protein